MKKYSGSQIALHWLVLLLIVITYAAMEFKGIFPKNSPGRYWMATAHYSCGVSVFILMLVRMVVRLFSPQPPVVPALSLWQKLSASLMHFILYCLFIILPALGVLSLYFGQKEWSFIFINMPISAVKNSLLQSSLKDVHELLANTGYFIVGLHAAAALMHHYIWRDNTLLRMMPGKHRD
ncbi:cytochrome b561 [Raoultella planticola]|uniref:cytochrome b561 n=1 Tax=Raoultella planticola TaxID=575 RepID=UPI000C1B0A75|nr:cytochrome b561 [Raoultella planticola]MBE0089979.1 cytochrome b561 [Raoultella planticola]MCE9857903.1 cytochrome b561 [Raoultella planticola]PIM81902.1 cytochrome b [Raoultella planticola]QRX97719.1 cytochrome b561 [Raoultella planticola]SPZ32646.1 Cytochrome b561 homolog 1 [Raoultella planticola]